MFIPPRRNTKLNDLVKKLYIADSDGFWYRNTNTLNKLKECNKFRGELIEALDEEKAFLNKYINDTMQDKFEKNKPIPTRIQLGGWYYELLYKPEILYFEFGPIKVEKSPWSSDYSENMEAEDGDIYYETDNALVQLLER